MKVSFPSYFKESDVEEEIREAFRVFDKEGNGFISTPGENKNICFCCTKKVFQTWMRSCTLLEMFYHWRKQRYLKKLKMIKLIVLIREIVAVADIDDEENVNYEELDGRIAKGLRDKKFEDLVDPKLRPRKNVKKL